MMRYDQRDPARVTLTLTRAIGTSVLCLLLAHPARAVTARGAIAGKVFDGDTKGLLSEVDIDARALTSDEEFHVVTGADGVFYLDDAPTGVYSFTLRAGGVEYAVSQTLDVRVGMPFLLESCFELDRKAKTARVREECNSGFVESARVATIGPHRFLIPPDRSLPDSAPQEPQDVPRDLPDGQEPASPPLLEEEPASQPDSFAEDSDALSTPALAMPDAIMHDELQCLTYDHFPLVDASIAPGPAVQISRVYFRSDKYPDFYYVDMGPEHPTVDDFRAILPKPSPETERIFYYVESIDREFESLQTPEYDPEVLEVQACKDRGAAWFTGEDPSIVVGATTAGASAVPPGFQALGITGFVSSVGVATAVGGAAAAGGGVVGTTTGLVLVVGGAGAAAAGTTVVVTGDKEASDPR